MELGKHLTAGIVDEHSHIATSAVNEGAQNSSAEVTIEDVIDPNDINIYRNFRVELLPYKYCMVLQILLEDVLQLSNLNGEKMPKT